MVSRRTSSGRRRSSAPQRVRNISGSTSAFDSISPWRRHPGTDGTFHGNPTEQLTLIDMPRLVAAPDLAPTVEGISHNQSSYFLAPLADLGDVLAQVLQFHEAFDLPREPLPTDQVADALAELRVRLLREEVEEFADAAHGRDLVAVADALADIVYVAYGAAVTYGIDLDAVVAEVHRSNMSKLDDSGRPVLRDDGKVLKSARYRPPNVGAVISTQLALFGDGDDFGPRLAAVPHTAG